MTRDEFMDVVYDELYSDGDNNRANRIIDAADDYVDEYAPHWIPVTERLPEKEGRYLVTNSKIGAWHVDVDFYRPYMGGWMYDQGVTAWMPLPEPYRGVTE